MADFTSGMEPPPQKKTRRRYSAVKYASMDCGWVTARGEAESCVPFPLDPGARQTGGLEVSIVALFCIHNTLPPPLQFPDASSQRENSGRMRRGSGQTFDPPTGLPLMVRKPEERAKKIMLPHFRLGFCFFWRTALTHARGVWRTQRSPALLSPQTRSAWEVTSTEQLLLERRCLMPLLRTVTRLHRTRFTSFHLHLKTSNYTKSLPFRIPWMESLFFLPNHCTWSQDGSRVPLCGALH